MLSLFLFIDFINFIVACSCCCLLVFFIHFVVIVLNVIVSRYFVIDVTSVYYHPIFDLLSLLYCSSCYYLVCKRTVFLTYVIVIAIFMI